MDISFNQLWLQIPDSNELVQFIDLFIAVFLLQDSLYGGHPLFSLLSSIPLALGYVCIADKGEGAISSRKKKEKFPLHQITEN